MQGTTIRNPIFQVVKFIQRVPQPVYELSDLQDHPTEDQFYNYKLLKVTVSPKFEIYKIVRTPMNGGIKQHLVLWKGYEETFNSGVNASDIKKI